MALNSLKLGLTLAALSAEPAFAQEQSSSLPVASNNTIVYVPTGEIKPEDIPCWQSHACTPAEVACERLEDFSIDYNARMKAIMAAIDSKAFDDCLATKGYTPLNPDVQLTAEVQAQNDRTYTVCLSDMRQPETVRSPLTTLREEEARLLIACKDEAVKALYKKSKVFPW